MGRGPGSSARAGSASSGFSVVDPSPDAASAAGSYAFGGSSGEASLGGSAVDGSTSAFAAAASGAASPAAGGSGDANGTST